MDADLSTDFAAAVALLGQSASVLLTMHERMDGDDGGSLLAVAEQLRSMGKQTTCVIYGGVPPQLSFLPGSGSIFSDVPDGTTADLLVTFGCANRARVNLEKIDQLDVPVLNIDHHPDNERYGTVNVVDECMSSVAEMVYNLFVWAEWEITRSVATNLLAGMMTDTGSFKHSSTQSSTLRAAADLVSRGATTNAIARRAFGGYKPEVLKAWSTALEHLTFDVKNKILYGVFPPEDEVVKKIPASSFSGLIDMLNAVPEAVVSMLLRQEGNRVKGTMRSDAHKGGDVSKIARTFGGGGHTLASGFAVEGELVQGEDGTWQVQK